MKHCGTQTLETERLILRRFTVRDADAMYTNWAADPEVTRYLTWPAHAGVETSYEGTQRSADRNNQGICDTSWYALLRAERPARKDARK